MQVGKLHSYFLLLPVFFMVKKKMKINKPIGIYIHIPFCQKKCNYCDFASIPRSQWDESVIKRYVYSLKTEIRQTAEKIRQTLTVDTIFIGGGTPSIIESLLIGEILDTVKKHFLFQPDSEVTIEVNPGTVDIDKMNQYVELGINRLSIGAQSLYDKNLQILGRIHDRKTILDTYNFARKTGFSTISLDFIYGLPGQSLKNWKSEIKEISGLSPEHLSLYCLTPEKGTPLGEQIFARCVSLPDDEEQVEMMSINHRILTDSGYKHYEISNYALPGHESKHNLKYWRSEDYLGFGSSSCSYFNRRRWSNIEDLSLYMERLESGRSAISFSERLSADKQMGEYMMMGLRISEGISSAKFQKRFGKDIMDIYRREITELLDKNWLQTGSGDIPGDTTFFVPPGHFPIQNEIAGYFIRIHQN
jgi:oxygen-independent coproporphyrinogen III oxidase